MIDHKNHYARYCELIFLAASSAPARQRDGGYMAALPDWRWGINPQFKQLTLRTSHKTGTGYGKFSLVFSGVTMFLQFRAPSSLL